MNGYARERSRGLQAREGRARPIARSIRPRLFERLRRCPTLPSTSARAGLDRFHLAAARRACARERRRTSRPCTCPASTSSPCSSSARRAPPTSPSLDARLAAVREYYRFVDRLIGEATAEPRRERRARARRRSRAAGARRGAGRRGRCWCSRARPVAPGDLGRRLRARHRARRCCICSACPMSRELEGRVLEAALEPAFREGPPGAHASPRTAAARRPRPRRAPSTRTCSRSCKSLGYIQ